VIAPRVHPPRGMAHRAFAMMSMVALALATSATAAVRAPAYETQVINPDLNGGMLVNGSRALLVWGSDGTILRSVDAGRTWNTARTRQQTRICAPS
jgi:photosystem II stability/assembly factor-like uncharacterized protein